MRKQMDGLVCPDRMLSEIDLRTRNLYLFCSKDRVKLKVLEIGDDRIRVYYNEPTAISPYGRKTRITRSSIKGVSLAFGCGLSIIQNTHIKTHI